jgi:hypothetical protein
MPPLYESLTIWTQAQYQTCILVVALGPDVVSYGAALNFRFLGSASVHRGAQA